MWWPVATILIPVCSTPDHTWSHTTSSDVHSSTGNMIQHEETSASYTIQACAYKDLFDLGLLCQLLHSTT